ncbi:MAG: hypothetical protein WCK37_01080 [Candidatus Falkowbacteria bacterium]
MSNTILIANGPSREELFDGLRLFTEKRVVNFIIEDNGRQMTLPAIMQGISPEDGSGQCWNINFLVDTKIFLNLNLTPDIRSKANKKGILAIKVKAYYSTKLRRGAINCEIE